MMRARTAERTESACGFSSIGSEDLPPNSTAETFAALVLGAIYATTLEWIHRDDYDLEARTAAIGVLLVSLLPDRGDPRRSLNP